jgi:hypothetical protein
MSVCKCKLADCKYWGAVRHVAVDDCGQVKYYKMSKYVKMK